ncbi:methyltransferase domain-containing protein [Deltaproteobacteria bacterium OttesenSCG-928-M10]|nr:methyltransferase domain-containing protein [Deltaproteobacteria bacterium OttesenSCG-928-M10]
MKSKSDTAVLKNFGFTQCLADNLIGYWQTTCQKAQAALDSPLLLFGKEIIRSPRQAGAIIPSGRRLAEAMARHAVADKGLIVELGSGTGSVTEALLNKGLPPERIIAVEQSAEMTSYLRSRFPRITVIHGDATRLTQLLPEWSIDTIVSSIPLVSLPSSDRESIIQQIQQVANGKLFIQFTYFWGGRYLEDAGFKPLYTELVLKNFPPARVMTFTV